MLETPESERPSYRREDDVLAPPVVADPYSYFNALREREPVYWNGTLGA